MPRTTVHLCSQCGFQSAQWHGQCPDCGEWNTLVEERAPARAQGARVAWRRARARAPRLRAPEGPVAAAPAARSARRPCGALSTGIGELDRVLGGGLVPGSLVLLGGSPGIGKSTLTNMVLGHLQAGGRRTLYVSGEESAEQVRLRAERLAGGHAAAPRVGAHPALRVPVLAETDLETILATLAAEAPQVCVIDSVQTLRSAELSGAPGSVGQVREVAARIMELAKERSMAVILVGHVTKDGALAGPRVLEHLVDCVLQFEGERERPYRELRALKNRFGSTNEAGLFEMRQGGLVEVLDASARFVAEATRAPGQRRARRDGGLAAAARGGPGAGRALRARAAAPGRLGARPQPPGARAGDPRPPRRRRHRRGGRVRQRRRRRAPGRARLRPRGRPRGRQRGARGAAARPRRGPASASSA